MSFNYPNNPIEGTTYTPVGGYQYVYTDGKWRVIESPQVRATAEARSRVVNGAFQTSQENGITVMTVNQAYPADQWRAQVNGIVFGTRKTTATAHQIEISVTTGKALAASDYLMLQQLIEGVRVWDFNYGTATALPSVLRFDVFASVGGSYGVALNNGALNRSLVLSFTVPAAVWTTITLPIPGDISGTWAIDNTVGLLLNFTFACGSTFQTAPNVWTAGNFLAPTGMTNGALTTNNIFYLRNVGLYLDPDATGLAPKWQMPDEAQELQACMRYWQKFYINLQNTATSGISYSTTGAYGAPMRIVPALSGVHFTSTGFPATVGVLTNRGTQMDEYRTANATGPAQFVSVITANARM